MRLQWSSKALSDLVRLHEFLSVGSKEAAARTVKGLTAAVGKLAQHPRLGEPMPEFDEREVRRLVVGQYEIRYAVANSGVTILRLWHTREER